MTGSPRIYANLTLALLASIATAQEPGKTITYTAPATSVKKVLADLSVKAGITLEPAVLTANKIIILRLKDAPLDQVMERIALVTQGKWDKTASGYRLVRDDERMKADARAALENEAQIIRKSIGDKAAALEKAAAFDATIAKTLASQLQDVEKRMNPNSFDNSLYEQQSRIEERSPAGRALARALRLLDPSDLAGLPVEARVVYSTAPNRMQKALGNGGAAVLRQYAKEHAVWADAIHQVYGEVEPTTYYGLASSRKPLKQDPAKMLLIVTRSGFGSSLGLHLMIADTKGRIVSESRTYIQDSMQKLEKTMQEASAGNTTEEPLKFSEFSQRLVASFQEAQKSRKGFPVLEDDVKKALLNPEQNDPLSFIPSEALIQIGEKRNENVAAVLPDIVFFGTAFLSGTAKLTPTTFLKTTEALQTSIEEKDGWLVVQPAAINDGHVINGDRSTIGRLVRSIYKEGRLTLDEAAVYALKSGGKQEDLMGLILAGLVNPTAIEVLESGWDALKFYGLLNAQQMQLIKSHQPMPLRMMSPEQKAIVADMVYGSMQRLSKSYRAPVSPDEDTDYWNTLEREPTEALPNGVPDTGVLQGEIVNEDVLFLGKQEDPNAMYMEGRGQTVDELAQQLYTQDRPDLFPWMRDRKIVVDTLRLGTRTRIELLFQFTPDLSLNSSLIDNKPAAGSTYTLATLPGDVKKRFDEAMERVKKQYANAKPGQFTAPNSGAGSPPPARS